MTPPAPPPPTPADAARVVMTADELRAMADYDERIANDRHEGTLLWCSEGEAVDLLARADRLRALADQLDREAKERAERTVHCHDCGQPVRPMEPSRRYDNV